MRGLAIVNLLVACIAIVACAVPVAVSRGEALPVRIMPDSTPLATAWGAGEWGALGASILGILGGGGLALRNFNDARSNARKLREMAGAETDAQALAIMTAKT